MKRRIYCSWLSLDKSLHLSLQACKVDRPGGHAEPDHALEVAGLQTADQLGWREVRRELGRRWKLLTVEEKTSYRLGKD